MPDDIKLFIADFFCSSFWAVDTNVPSNWFIVEVWVGLESVEFADFTVLEDLEVLV